MFWLAARLTSVPLIRRRVLFYGLLAGVCLGIGSVLVERRVFSATVRIGFSVERCVKCGHAKRYCDGPELPSGEIFCTCE
jgi:hypothetical protein